ncbi:mycofactocin biosynthesis chaperone MftB [Kineococcus aurantiacus]|uniref:Putative mycofactocin binding protein MftB n=1 Tax=Kineococcus aurantiacus TaxID=37633 RepID=A0A7Y9DR09_9ACTN|nr:putative mycofactocin binding protein MftB [Kineococcus aurantiacus]
MALQQAWRLSPSVALRPEPFGALVYDFTSRRLSFLKRPELLSVVRELADRDSVAAAFDAAGIRPDQRQQYMTALNQLARNGTICPRAKDGGSEP